MSKKVIKVLGFSAKESQFVIKTEEVSFTLNNETDFVKQADSATVDYFLAVLAGSIHAVGQHVSRELQMSLKSIQVEISGELGLEHNAQISGFKKIDVVVKPTSNASIVQLKQWIDLVKVRCPVYSKVNQSTAVILTLVKEYDQVRVA